MAGGVDWDSLGVGTSGYHQENVCARYLLPFNIETLLMGSLPYQLMAVGIPPEDKKDPEPIPTTSVHKLTGGFNSLPTQSPIPASEFPTPKVHPPRVPPPA